MTLEFTNLSDYKKQKYWKSIHARISNKNDVINAIDNIPERTVIDEGLNKHGDAFIDFLIEARMAITNGRARGRNEFSSVSTRGKSLVDYIAVPQENFSSCISCDVYPISEIIDNSGLCAYISENSKPSDHSPIKLIHWRIFKKMFQNICILWDSLRE